MLDGHLFTMNPIVGPEMFSTIKYIQLNQQREEQQTSQELEMLSSITHNCQETNIVKNTVSQLSKITEIPTSLCLITCLCICLCLFYGSHHTSS